MAAGNTGAEAPLKLLSLDGGGIRGISTLIILKHLMKRIHPPQKPCDYFDLIGGTSTGGIIAIMLGRLRMDVQECIDKYIELSSSAFTPKRSKVNFLSKINDKWEVNGKYRADVLVNEMRQIVQDSLDDKDPEAKLFDPNAACKGRDCTIWQAARATSAAATFFDPIQIGRQTFVDGATGMNNPVEQVVEEANSIWPDAIQKGRIQCLVSIGTGIPDLKNFGDNLKQVAETLKSISIETEKTEERFYNNHQLFGFGARYFRFSVDKGLADVQLDDSRKLDEIEASTEYYLRGPRVKQLISTFVAARTPTLSLLNRQMKDTHLSWLKTVDPLAQHSDARRYRELDSETGQWFLNDPFKRWKTEAKSFVWLIGKPGLGKTILSSAIIDTLEKESDGIVIYFYISFRDEATQDPTNIRTSLLMQLVRQLVREDEIKRDHFYIPKVFQALFEKYSHSQHPLDEHVDKTFEGLLHESKHTYIVIDALDECPDQISRRRILEFLEHLRQTSDESVHVLVTSRQETDIKTAVEEMKVPKRSVLMDVAKVNADIETYLKHTMRQLPYKKWRKESKKQVAKTLMSKADGVFRWVALQLLDLRETFTGRLQDTDNALKNLPKDLKETYEVILRRIQNSRQSGPVLSILKWLAYSHRPISLGEVAEIAIFEIERYPPAGNDDYTASYHPSNRFPDIQTIRKMLSGLITVSGIDDYQDEVPNDQNGTVSFSHFTVKEYLEHKDVKPRDFRIEETAAHWYIMHSCLAYLKCYDDLCGGLQDFSQDLQIRTGNFDSAQDEAESDSSSVFDFSESEHSYIEQVGFAPFPLLLYAAKRWWQHGVSFYKSSPQGVKEKVPTAIRGYQGQLNRLTIKVALAKSNANSGQDPFSAPDQGKYSLKELSSILPDSFQDLQDESSTMEAGFDFEDYGALSSASLMGELGLVKLLVDGGVDIEKKDKQGCEPLVRAIESGEEAVVSFLLTRGVKSDYGCLPARVSNDESLFIG
ncbi:Patatin-like phospholipase domain [Fusarium oxysporum f. sp. vasinfectum]|nr:Patatin-like phospholipase domain [Fusarium oxysporum f. sp. vasinfectum]